MINDYKTKNKVLKALTNPSVYKELKKDAKLRKELDVLKRKADKADKPFSLSPLLVSFLVGIGAYIKSNKDAEEAQKIGMSARNNRLDKILNKKY